jgi:hypothetical protein
MPLSKASRGSATSHTVAFVAAGFDGFGLAIAHRAELRADVEVGFFDHRRTEGTEAAPLFSSDFLTSDF